jgi:hypothetical protein
MSIVKSLFKVAVILGIVTAIGLATGAIQVKPDA